jgi:hypothetical protein
MAVDELLTQLFIVSDPLVTSIMLSVKRLEHLLTWKSFWTQYVNKKISNLFVESLVTFSYYVYAYDLH